MNFDRVGIKRSRSAAAILAVAAMYAATGIAQAASLATLTTLVSFNEVNGSQPYASMIMDASGNLYGTTLDGNDTNGGEVYELSGQNHQTFTVLVSFGTGFGTQVGQNPLGGVVMDRSGNLYGTTEKGPPNQGYGTIFELSGSSVRW